MNISRCRVILLLFVICISLSSTNLLSAQGREEPGKIAGKATVVGDLILLEMNEGALGTQNLFDLDGRTLRFTPEKLGFRVENAPLQWDAEFGKEIEGSDITLEGFKIPFSGKEWDSFSIGTNGSIRFGGAAAEPGAGLGEGDRVRGSAGGRLGGVQVGRFDQLADAAGTIVNTVPAICVFMKPRMIGARYAKELPDRVVITWNVTEPWGNIQDFTWTKTINLFQAVLHKTGVIEMSYRQLHARDAIVGVYPMLAGTMQKQMATIKGTEKASIASNLNLRSVKITAVDGFFVRVSLETRGPVPQESDEAVAGVAYRVFFDKQKLASSTTQHDVTWTIRGFAPWGRRPGGRSHYMAFGPDLSRKVTVAGNTISIQGILPTALHGAKQIFVSAEAVAPGSGDAVDAVAPAPVSLTGIRSPEVKLSSLRPQDGPFPLVYEAFHYYPLPSPQDLTCSVISMLGDKFDFLAYYSDFRIDNQEAGTPSNGPLGSTGPAVTGIGATQSGLQTYCSVGRFQWQFIQPVYVDANQMYEQPPADAPVGTDHDITFYQQQLAEVSNNGKMQPYMYAMSQIAHEMGHRWSAFVSARVNGEIIPLGPTHWARGLQAPVAFPYQRPTEASIMGGGVWQDNFDGTFTQLDDDYYVPAAGWSYLDLYLMGLIAPAEVPDFFLLRDLVPAGKDANGRPIFKANRTKVSIQDVIAAEGPRTPAPDKSQRQFNTGMVMVVEHGKQPSRELIERTNAIRKHWIEYWSITTGRRSVMTANPQ